MTFYEKSARGWMITAILLLYDIKLLFDILTLKTLSRPCNLIWILIFKWQKSRSVLEQIALADCIRTSLACLSKPLRQDGIALFLSTSGGLACEMGMAASDSQGDYQLKHDKACEITLIWLVLVGNFDLLLFSFESTSCPFARCSYHLSSHLPFPAFLVFSSALVDFQIF